MMPQGAPSISKYGSLVRPDARLVALCARCARTALEAPPKVPPKNVGEEMESNGDVKKSLLCTPLRKLGALTHSMRNCKL